jgi:hypothetical protein
MAPAAHQPIAIVGPWSQRMMSDLGIAGSSGSGIAEAGLLGDGTMPYATGSL